MRFLALSHYGDETTLQVCHALSARHGPGVVRVVWAEELARAPIWTHRLKGVHTETTILLGDGTTLEAARAGVIFNRLAILPVPQFAAASRADQEYAAAEMQALCLSWLASLPCAVVNAPAASGLGGAAFSPLEWLLRAGRAGLPVMRYHFTTDPRWAREPAGVPHQWPVDPERPLHSPPVAVHPPLVGRYPTLYLEPLADEEDSVLVAGAQTVGRLGRRYGDALRSLARESHCDLLRVTFGRSRADRRWKVCRVDTWPCLRDPQEILAVVSLLEARLSESPGQPVVRP